MTPQDNPKADGQTETDELSAYILQQLRDEFNHIGDGRVLARPGDLLDFMLETYRRYSHHQTIDTLESLKVHNTQVLSDGQDLMTAVPLRFIDAELKRLRKGAA